MEDEEEYCSECKQEIARYHQVNRVPYCTERCRTNHYTPRTSQAIGPVVVVENGTEFLRGEHVIPHVVPFDMQSLIGRATDPMHVVYTDENMQLAIEVVPPGGVISREIHPTQTQFIRVERGHARVDIFYPENVEVLFRSYFLNAAEEATGGEEEDDGGDSKTSTMDTIIIHAGVYHKVSNLSATRPMKFYTVYSPHVH